MPSNDIISAEFALLYRHVVGHAPSPAVCELLGAAYARYLASMPPARINHGAFSLHLARHALRGSIRLRLADVWTRLGDSHSLLRHKLNAMVALAECHGLSWRMMNPPRSLAWAWVQCAGLPWKYLTLLATSFIWVASLWCGMRWRQRMVSVPEHFRDKRILVTGGSRGLGLELTRQLLACGASVAVVARSPEHLERLRAETAASGHAARLAVQACDLADRAATERALASLIEQTGPFDVVILNAGVKYADRAMFAVEKILQTFQVNVHGVLHCLHAVLPSMQARGA
ncbi:MAG: SDR family NAD(P)-dependent oxidoreductase, partial [Deltaproteobacteria bacterium]|nr:SDR family NAD(P)-dependent oxidoreductase [Deltaproteobacteria bacterium]